MAMDKGGSRVCDRLPPVKLTDSGEKTTLPSNVMEITRTHSKKEELSWTFQPQS